MDDNYMCLLSYRNTHGEIVRVEAKGTFKEIVTKLGQCSEKVISAEIFHIVATVTR